jgi:hypothetical protein
VGSLLGGVATAAEAEGRVGLSRWRGEAAGSSLGGGALGGGATAAEAEGRAAFSRWRGEATCSSLGGGATAEAEGRADGTPRDSVARRIVKFLGRAFLSLA